MYNIIHFYAKCIILYNVNLTLIVQFIHIIVYFFNTFRNIMNFFFWGVFLA